MAIFKSIDNPSTKIGGSKKAIDYVAKKAEITRGFNCSDDREQAYKDFQETKELYGKIDGRQFKHFVLSFEEGIGTAEIAINMGEDIAKTLFKDYEVFLAVHTDTENTHCHLLVNSVNLSTGNKYRHSKHEYEIYKEKVVEIGLNYGIEPTQEKEKQIGEVRTDSKEKRKAIENHFNDVQKSDIVNTYMILTNVLENEKIKSIDEFKNKMDKEGIIVDWEPQKKNITFEIKPEFANSKKRKFRLSNLNKTFSDERLTKENLINSFDKNIKDFLENQSKYLVYSSCVRGYENNLYKLEYDIDNKCEIETTLDKNTNEIIRQQKSPKSKLQYEEDLNDYFINTNTIIEDTNIKPYITYTYQPNRNEYKTIHLKYDDDKKCCIKTYMDYKTNEVLERVNEPMSKKEFCLRLFKIINNNLKIRDCNIYNSTSKEKEYSFER